MIRLRITVLVDNTAPSVHPHNGIFKAYEGDAPLLAESGLSLLIDGDSGHRLLMDAGRSEKALLHNLQRLDIPLSSIDLVFITHDHFDHTGGLTALIEQGIPVYTHPESFSRRRYQGVDALKLVSSSPDTIRSLERGERRGADNLTEILPRIWSSGRIERISDFEEVEGFFSETEGGLERDDIEGEMALFLESSSGIVVLCGCGHPGVVNIVRGAVDAFNQPPYLIMGGFHLKGATRRRIDRTIAELERIGVVHVAPMHCTGFEALSNMGQRIPGFELASVGGTVTL